MIVNPFKYLMLKFFTEKEVFLKVLVKSAKTSEPADFSKKNDPHVFLQPLYTGGTVLMTLPVRDLYPKECCVEQSYL